MKILMAPEVWDLAEAITEHCKVQEFGWSYLVEPLIERGQLWGARLYGIFVSTQDVTGATVDVHQESNFEFMDWLEGKGRGEECGKINGWGHSHVNMAVSPSSRDTEFWIQSAKAGEQPRIFVATIQNRKKEMAGWIYLFTPGFGLSVYSCDVEREESRTPGVKELAAQLVKDKTQHRVFAAGGPSGKNFDPKTHYIPKKYRVTKGSTDPFPDPDDPIDDDDDVMASKWADWFEGNSRYL